MPNPKEVNDEAFSTIEATTVEDTLNLRDENRSYTIVHLGINSAFAVDNNVIFLAYNTGSADGGVGLKKIPLVPGLVVQVGPENGPIALEYKANGGAPLFAVLAGESRV